MILFKKIRLKLGFSILYKHLKKTKLERSNWMSFDQSSNIGVIFKAENNSQIEVIKDFLHFLSEKKNNIFAIAYVDTKKIPDFLLIKQGFNFFSRKDLNMFFLPQSQMLTDFINKPFDILIDLSFERNLTFNYITSLSKAKFKIGVRKFKSTHYDLMFELNYKNNIETLIENIKQYTDTFTQNIKYKAVAV